MALTPRYKNLSSMVEGFYSLLNDMEELNPKDPTLRKPVVESKPKAAPVVESKPVKAKVIAEAAPLSQYSSSKGAVNSFRVLAGLEEREISPWDPGIFGQTKTVQEMKEDYGMAEKTVKPLKESKTGYSAKAARIAVAHSKGVLDQQRNLSSYLSEGVDDAVFGKLSEACTQVAVNLRAAVEDAPGLLYDKAYALADRHDRHAAIYAKGKYPKQEAVAEMNAMVDAIEPTDFMFIVNR